MAEDDAEGEHNGPGVAGLTGEQERHWLPGFDYLLRQDDIDWDIVLSKLQHRDQDDGLCRQISDAYTNRQIDYFGFLERRRSPAHFCVEQGAPIEVLRALYDAAPFLFAEVKPSPLAVACHTGASDPIIRLLLGYAITAYDVGVECDHDECCTQYIPDDPIQPLHFLTLNLELPMVDLRILRLLLLREYPQGATITTYIGTNEETGIDLVLCPLQSVFVAFLDDTELNELDETIFWEHCQLLLKAAEFGTVRDDELNGRRFKPFHAFIKYILTTGLPEEEAKLLSQNDDRAKFLSLVKFIAKKAGEDAKERDDQGMLPLHIVVDKPSDRSTIPAKEDVMRTIVGVHQEAVRIPDVHGRLPLHKAIIHGWPCISLIQASVPTLGFRDPITGFLPFQLAACSFSSKPLDDIWCSFQGDSRDTNDDELGHLTHIFNSIRVDTAVIERATEEAQLELKSFELIYVLLRASPSLIVKSDMTICNPNPEQKNATHGQKRKRGGI